MTAVLLSAAMAGLLAVSGRFNEIIAVAAILVAGMYAANYLAAIVVRVREPEMARPFRAWGYPVTTGLVLAGSGVFLVAAVHDDPVVRGGRRRFWRGRSCVRLEPVAHAAHAMINPGESTCSDMLLCARRGTTSMPD